MYQTIKLHSESLGHTSGVDPPETHISWTMTSFGKAMRNVATEDSHEMEIPYLAG